MCSENIKLLIRRYHVFGARTLSNYWWGSISMIGGFCFFIAGLYSYYLNFFSTSWPQGHDHETHLASSPNALCPQGLAGWVCYGQAMLNKVAIFETSGVSDEANKLASFKLAFFPQGLSMCFYGLIGVLLGTFLFFCIVFKIGCGFTEFNKEKGAVRIFRLGFPGKDRYIDYSYSLESIQCICVKLSSSVVPSSQRGVYMRLKVSENQTRDIPLDLYSEKTSLEQVELQAADLSKFLRVSLSIL